MSQTLSMGRSSTATVFTIAVVGLLLTATGCDKDKDKDAGAGLVSEAGVTSTPVAEAGAVDLTQCAGCSGVTPAAWTFEGVFADDKCTKPLAQIVVPACGGVPAVGATNLTYVDAQGAKKAGEVAAVTILEQVGPGTPRYRKSGTTCVKANEAATDLTPASCTGNRVCRDQTGGLSCTSCRTFANGCPDYEETRMYATIDEGAKAATGGGGGGNIARLQQCCAAIGAEAKKQGNAPELIAASAQCSALVAQIGPNGNAPELGALRTLMAGRSVPAVCSGF